MRALQNVSPVEELGDFHTTKMAFENSAHSHARIKMDAHVYQLVRNRTQLHRATTDGNIEGS